MESKIINRGELIEDKQFEKGFGVTIHNPAARNQEHVHLNCEVMWFISKGHSRHYSETRDHKEHSETECFPGTVGYVAPNEIHVGMNLNNDITGECIFFYAGVNTKEDAGTVFLQDVDVVEEYMRERGKNLKDVL